MCPLKDIPEQSVITAGTVSIERIRVATDAPAPVKFAAGELQRYLDAILGISLPIEEGPPQRGTFFIMTAGDDPTAQAILGQPSADMKKYDRAVVAVRDGCVWLVGENQISALYAVYDLLKARCDARFFGPGWEHEYVPRRAKLAFPSEGDVLRQGSAFALRDVIFNTYDVILSYDFVVKNRINVIFFDQSVKADLVKFLHDRGVLLRGPGHNWRAYVPEASLFESHPEYFPMTAEGKRQVNNRTACFSNPEVRRIFLGKLRADLRANPYWDIFAFWPEDCPDPFYCACPECATMSLPDWYMTLANEAAAVLAEELPQARFEFIAYHGTRTPPKQVKQLYQDGRNMLLDLCIGYSRDIYHPLAQATHGGAPVYEMYRNWRAYLNGVGFKGRIILMEYYNLCEEPNQGPRGRALLWPMEVVRADTQFYHQDKLDGVFDCACFEQLCWPSPFNLWTWFQLQSDFRPTIEQLKDDFYPRYFGHCGTEVRRYMDALEAAMHQHTSPQNIADVSRLVAMLESIDLSGADTQLIHRLRVVQIHHEYCVLLKEIFQAFIDNNAKRWQELEKPFRDFFTVTHWHELQGEVDTPPAWANTWYDWWVTDVPETNMFYALLKDYTLDRLVNNEALH